MKKIFALLLVAITLAGCGSEAPTMSANAGKKSKDLVLAPGNNNANNQQNQQQFDVKGLLSDISQRYQRLNGLQSQIVLYDSYNGKSVSCKNMAYFQKPNRCSIQVLEHSDSKAVGTKIVLTGGSTAAVKTKFVGFQVKINLPITDSRICSLRGDTLVDTGIVRMMNILLDPQAQVRLISQGSLSGKPVAMLEVVSAKSLRGITREVYCIDLQTRIPAIREMYEGTRLVSRMQFNNTVLDAQMPSNAFTND